MFEAVIRALKHEDIPVAGADRLVLTEHIAVMDLLVLGDALLLPDDDLALATVLKSPLFGFDEEQLFTLAYDREGSLRGCAAQAKPATIRRLTPPTARSTSSRDAARAHDAVRVLRACARARGTAASRSWRGSAPRPTTRSTNSSIWRSTMSGGKPRRCRAFCTGSASRRAR